LNGAEARRREKCGKIFGLKMEEEKRGVFEVGKSDEAVVMVVKERREGGGRFVGGEADGRCEWRAVEGRIELEGTVRRRPCVCV